MLSPCAKLAGVSVSSAFPSAVGAALRRTGLPPHRPLSTLLAATGPVPCLSAKRDIPVAVRSFAVSSAHCIAEDARFNDPQRILAPTCGVWQEDLYKMFPMSPMMKFSCKYLRGVEFHQKMVDQPFFDLITACMDMDYKGFLLVCGSKDYFQTWFILLHMHAWMFARRIHREGIAGSVVGYNRFLRMFWEQVEYRLDLYKEEFRGIRGKEVKEAMEFFKSHYITNSLMFERAIHSPDHYLAKALAYMLFDKEECVNPEAILIVCNYWREQVAAVDHLSREELFIAPTYVFPPLLDHPDVEPAEEKRARLLMHGKEVDHRGFKKYRIHHDAFPFK